MSLHLVPTTKYTHVNWTVHIDRSSASVVSCNMPGCSIQHSSTESFPLVFRLGCARTRTWGLAFWSRRALGLDNEGFRRDRLVTDMEPGAEWSRLMRLGNLLYTHPKLDRLVTDSNSLFQSDCVFGYPIDNFGRLDSFQIICIK